MTKYGPACPQQAFDFPDLAPIVQDAVELVINGIYSALSPSAEDCECANLRMIWCFP